MWDLFNREIYYLRISVTDKCNLRCRYCMPEEGVQLKRHQDLLSFEQIVGIVREAVGLGFRKFRLTGGEPLVRRGIVDLTRMIAAVEGVEFLGMTTNGSYLAKYAKELKEAGLVGVNISLDTLNPNKYAEITRGGKLQDVLDGIESAVANKFDPIKINVVVTPATPASEIAELEEFCAARGILLQRIKEFSLLAEKGDTQEYEKPPKCGECNRLRLTADGKLKPCLHSDSEIGVDFEDIRESLKKAILGKPGRGLTCTGRNMIEIGG
jgi:cyclic pyranopterin phosphate synthase